MEQQPKNAIVPFGKYKGQPLEILQNDRPYLEWLTGQDWFRSRFQTIYNVVINNFGEPAETPEHNRMQVKFLQVEWRLKFTLYLWPNFLEYEINTEIQHFNEMFFKQGQQIDAFLNEAMKKQCSARNGLFGDLPSEPISRTHSENLRLFQEYYTMIAPNFPLRHTIDISPPLFEESGFDVSFIAKIERPKIDIKGIYQRQRFFETFNSYKKDVFQSIYIELKPTIGDDFPAILRQINNNRKRLRNCEIYLVVSVFNGEGATFEEVKAFFANSKIRLILESDIEKVIIPTHQTEHIIQARQIEMLINNMKKVDFNDDEIDELTNRRE